MNKVLHSKSVAIGLLLRFLVSFTIAAVRNVSTGYHGRFQIATSGNRALLVDTATGKVWHTSMPGMKSDPDFYESKLSSPK